MLLFSSAVTLILTFLQLYLDYRRDVGAIVNRLNDVRLSYVASLSESLWNLDRTQIELQLQGILRLPDITAVEVRESGSTAKPLAVAVGHRGSRATVNIDIPIVYVVRGTEQQIGSLYVEATLLGVYRELADKTLVILISQGTKTFLVSLFILAIFHHLVTRHLEVISSYMTSYDVRQPPPPLALARRAPRQKDELDRVVDAFNGISTNLQRAYDDLQHANADLMMDIGARREAEEALRTSEQRLRDFAEVATDWFWETGPDHRFTYISNQIGTFGIQPGGFHGRLRWENAADFDPKAPHWRKHIETLEHCEPFRDFVYRIDRPTGEQVFVSVSGKPLFDADGRFVGYRGTGRNVTATIESDRALRDAKNLAEAASRAKSEFLAGMSHELRTPLNAIMGLSEVLKGEMLGPLGSEQYRGYAADIHDSGRRLLGIISEILDVARIEAGETNLTEAVFPVGDLIETVRQVLGPEATAAGLDLTVEAVDPGLRLRADREALGRVLSNLISNAIKFTPAGGTVAVTARRAPDGGLDLSVADTGIGIARDDIPKLMQPFVQLDDVYKRQYAGAGLGLALARSIVELHGGAIAIDSTQGLGTVVTVTLPPERVLAPRTDGAIG